MKNLIWLVAVVAVSAGCAGPEHRLDPNALGPYSAAVHAGGFCFVSGKIGTRGGRFEDEAATAIEAMERELSASGLTLADLVQVTVYLTDIELYGSFNQVYAARLPAPYPARACVAVAALPGGARVEVQGLARFP